MTEAVPVTVERTTLGALGVTVMRKRMIQLPARDLQQPSRLCSTKGGLAVAMGHNGMAEVIVTEPALQ